MSTKDKKPRSKGPAHAVNVTIQIRASDGELQSEGYSLPFGRTVGDLCDLCGYPRLFNKFGTEVPREVPIRGCAQFVAP